MAIGSRYVRLPGRAKVPNRNLNLVFHVLVYPEETVVVCLIEAE